MAFELDANTVSLWHLDEPAETLSTVTTNILLSPIATDQTTANTLLNEIKVDYNLHIASTVFHLAADGATITSANATTLGTSITLVNEIKTDFNNHRVSTTFHLVADGDNVITSANATDLPTVLTLANEIRTKYVRHTQNSLNEYHLAGKTYNFASSLPAQYYLIGNTTSANAPGISGGPRLGLDLGARDNCRWFTSRGGSPLLRGLIGSGDAAVSTALTGATWTVECWIYVDKNPPVGGGVLLSWGGSGETQAANFLMNWVLTDARSLVNFWEVGAGLNVNTLSTSSIVPSKQWVHIAQTGTVVGGNRNSEFFIDGVSTSVNTGVFHALTDAVNTATSADASNLATVQTLANELKTDYNNHRANTGGVFHSTADVTNVVTSANATNQATANTLLNELKADFNLHAANSGGAYHSSLNHENILITAADAVDLATSITLVNQLKQRFNFHIGDLGYQAADGGTTGGWFVGANGAAQLFGGLAYLRVSNVARTALEIANAAADPSTITFDGSTLVFWPFQEEAQNRDLSPNGCHLVSDAFLNNLALTQNFPGVWGGVMPLSFLAKRFVSGTNNRLDGNVTQVQYDTFRDAAEYTLETWFMPETTTAHTIFTCGGTTNGGPLVDNDLFTVTLQTNRKFVVGFESELDFNHELRAANIFYNSHPLGELEWWYHLAIRKRSVGNQPYWRFDGVNDAIRVPHASVFSFDRTEPLTLCAWIHTVSSGTAKTIVSKVGAAVNTITSANATNQTTANTLLNELKVDYNSHRANLGGGGFDGVDDYIGIGTVLSHERTDTFSISAWVRLPGINSGSQLIISNAQSGATKRGWNLYIHFDGITHFKLTSTLNTNDLDITASAVRVDDGALHHLLVTYNGNSLDTGVEFYIDNVLSAKGIVLNSLTATTVGTGPLGIGVFGDPTNLGFFKGVIRDVTVWDSVLTAPQVSELYNSGTPGDVSAVSFVANLDAWWKIDSTDTTAVGGVADYGPSNFDGTAQGGFIPGDEPEVWHSTVDMVNVVTSSPSTDLATSITLANELKADYNAHIANTGGSFHGVADAVNTVTSANASDLATVQTLANELKVDFNNHIADIGGSFHALADSAAGYEFYIDTSNRLFFRLENSTGLRIEKRVTSATVTNGVIHMVAVTYSGSGTAAGVNIYDDTVLQTMTTVTDTLASGTTENARQLQIGARDYSVGSRQFYDDFAKEISVWNVALTVAQLLEVEPQQGEGQAAPNLLTTSMNANLVGWWRLDADDTGSVVDDHSTQGNNGTPEGGLDATLIASSEWDIFKNGVFVETVGPARNAQAGDVYAATDGDSYIGLNGSSQAKRQGSTRISNIARTDTEIYNAYLAGAVEFHQIYYMQAEDANASGGIGEEIPYYRTWVVPNEPDLDASEYDGPFFGMSINFIKIQVLATWVARNP